MRKGVQHNHSFAHGYPIVPAPFAEKAILSTLNGIGSLVKNQLTRDIWVCLWTVNSTPLIYMSVFMPESYCLDYCYFVVSFEVGKYESFNFVLVFFSRLFWLLSVSQFHMGCGISVSISTKKPDGILIAMCWVYR